VTPTEIGHRRDIRDHSGSRGLHRDPAWNRHRRQHRFGRGRSPALWQATARAEELLDALATDRPPIQQLNALLGYLREVVLARIAEEDRQAFPLLRRAAPASIDRLRQDHLLLCDDVDNLAVAAVAGGFGEPDPGAASPHPRPDAAPNVAREHRLRHGCPAPERTHRRSTTERPVRGRTPQL
jgi:hypothetical protein